eukprot:m.102735 g.102735  ORF g.102735 m.102735 type:complete len:1752 (-) comp8834_c0_seq1:426-5681(-)
MDSFRSHVLDGLTREQDTVTETALLLHRHLGLVKLQLPEAASDFLEDLCLFLDKYFTLRTAATKLPWSEYIVGPVYPPGLVLQQPENLLNNTLRLDFVYDPRKEHAALAHLVAAADALHGRAELLRDIAQSGSQEDSLRDLSSNESALKALMAIARAIAALATAYDVFAARTCAPGMSIPERDSLFVRMGEKKGPVTLATPAGWFRTQLSNLRQLFPASPSQLPHTTAGDGIAFTIAKLAGTAELEAQRMTDMMRLLADAVFPDTWSPTSPLARRFTFIIKDMPGDEGMYVVTATPSPDRAVAVDASWDLATATGRAVDDLTRAVALTLVAMPGSPDGKCWFRDIDGALHLHGCDTLFGPCFSTDSDGTIRVRVYNRLLASRTALARPASQDVVESLARIDALGIAVSWLGQIEALQDFYGCFSLPPALLDGHAQAVYVALLSLQRFCDVQTGQDVTLSFIADNLQTLLMRCYQLDVAGAPTVDDLPVPGAALDDTEVHGIRAELEQPLQPVDISDAVRSVIDIADVGGTTIEGRLQFAESLIQHFPSLGPRGLPPSWQQPELLHCAIRAGKDPSILALFGPCVNQVDAEGVSPLMRAVMLFKENTLELVQRQVRCLLALGADPSVPNPSGATPLDLAAGRLLDELVIDLIRAGGTSGTLTSVIGFYKHLHALPLPSELEMDAIMAIELLCMRSRTLHWQLALDSILPKKADNAVMIVSTEHFGDRALPEHIYKQIVDERGAVKGVSRYGRRTVGMAIVDEFALFFKFRPEMPGLESAAGILARLLFGDWAAPYVELLRWNMRFPVLLSQEIPGESLHDVLLHHPDRLAALDPRSLSESLIAAMLTNPEDGKPDNYIVEPMENDRFRIVCIDNDHSFVPAVTVQSGAPALHVKCVLFCLEQMFEPIHPDVQAALVGLDVMAAVQRWLDELNYINYRHFELFQANATTLLDDRGDSSFVGCPLRPGVVSDLVNKLCRLQQVLIADPEASHLALLTALDPLLGMRYDTVLQRQLSVMDRFKEADGQFFSTNFTVTQGGKSEEHFISTLGVPQLLKAFGARHVPSEVVSHVLQGQLHSPVQALQELETMAADYRRYLASGIESFTTMAAADPQKFGSVSIVAIQEEVLRTLDLSTIPVSRQLALLQALRGRDLRHLVFRRCDALTDDDLRPHIAMLPNLTSLVLVGCTHLALGSGNLIRTGVLATLASRCLALVALTLSELPLLEEFKSGGVSRMTFPVLRLLKVAGCPRLREIAIGAPQLGTLDVSYNASLEHLHVTCPLLQTLDITGCARLSHASIAQFVTTCGTSTWLSVDTSLKYQELTALFGPSGYSFFRDMAFRRDDVTAQERMLLALCTDPTGLRVIASDPFLVEEAVTAVLSTLFTHAAIRAIQNSAFFIVGSLWPSAARPQHAAFEGCDNVPLLAFLHTRIFTGVAIEAARLQVVLRCLSAFPDSDGILLPLLHTLIAASPTDGPITLDLRQAVVDRDTARKFSTLCKKLNMAVALPDIDAAPFTATILRLQCSDPYFTVVNLSNCGLTDENIRALAGHLATARVEHLSLAGNTFSTAALEDLALALIDNTSLKIVDLSNNYVGAEGLRGLAAAFQGHRSLQVLDLSLNNLGPDGAAVVGPLLTTKSQLTRLSLAGNRMGDDGAREIGDLLGACESLRHLNLSHNSISGDGAAYLIAALASNTALQRLDLSNNDIADSTADALVQALQNTSLQALCLFDNPIRGQGHFAGLSCAVDVDDHDDQNV